MNTYPIGYASEESLGDILRRAIERREVLKTIGHQPTITQEAKAMNAKHIIFDLHFKGRAKINLIKILRTATGSGLKEAKDVIDAATGTDDTTRRWGGMPQPRYATGIRMTDAQYGVFVAEILKDDVVSLAEVRMDNVRTVPAAPASAFDFTKGSPY